MKLHIGCGKTKIDGFVNVDVIPFMERGWARHVFYDTGGGEMLAIWDLHDESVPAFDPAISTGLGLPNFVNHVAFGSADLDELPTTATGKVKRYLLRQRPLP